MQHERSISQINLIKSRVIPLQAVNYNATRSRSHASKSIDEKATRQIVVDLKLALNNAALH